MSRIGFVAVLYAVWISSACSTQEIEFERDGRDYTFERDGRDYIEDDRQRFAVNPGGTLTVDAELGTVRIRSSNNDEVDVLVRKRFRATDADQVRKAFSNIEVVIKQTYNGVRIEVEQIDDNVARWFWQEKVHGEIEVVVPVEFNLDLSTVSDDILTGKIVGSVTAKTLSGDISTGPTEGSARLESTSGNIVTNRVEGNVHASTLDGDIRTGPVEGDATLRSTSGSIMTNRVEGNVHASTLDGDIRAGPVEGDATLRSTTGNIVARSVAGKLSTSSLTGNIKQVR